MKIPIVPAQFVPPLDDRDGDVSLPPLLSRPWWLFFASLAGAIAESNAAVQPVGAGIVARDTRINGNSAWFATSLVVNRVSVYLASRSAVGSGSATAQIQWNDGIAAKIFTSAFTTLNSASLFAQSTLFLHADGVHPITWKLNYVSSGFYDLYVTMEKL